MGPQVGPEVDFERACGPELCEWAQSITKIMSDAMNTAGCTTTTTTIMFATCTTRKYITLPSASSASILGIASAAAASASSRLRLLRRL